MGITHFNPGHLSILTPYNDEKVRLHHNSFWQDQLQVALMYMPRTSFPWLDDTPVPPAFFVRLHGVFGPYPAHALRHGHDPDDLRNAEQHPSEWVARRGHSPWWRLFDERARVIQAVEQGIQNRGRMPMPALRELHALLTGAAGDESEGGAA